MKRTNPGFRINTVLILVFLILSIMITSLFQPKKAEAADIDNLPQYLNKTYDQYISRNPDVGGKGNYTPSFRFILYSPSSPGTSTRIRVIWGGVSPNHTAAPRCEDFNIDHARLTTDNATSGQIKTDSPDDQLSCFNTSYGFRIEGINKYDKSDRFPGYEGTVIRLSLTKSPQGTSTFTDIEVIGTSDRLSYIGDNTSSTPDSANGVSMSLPENSGNMITNIFAPPCNYPGGEATVWWKDADSGEDTNGGNKVNYHLREFLNGYNNGYKTIRSGDAGSGGGHFNTTFTPKAGAKYEIRFSPVRARSASHPANTIKVWVPFDSAAAYVKCPDPPEPTVCKGNWVYATGANSWYRFRMFDRTPTISYPTPQLRSDAAGRGPWAGVSDANLLYDSGGLQNPGNQDITLPNEIQYLGGYVLIERWWHHDANGNGTIDWDYNHGSDTLPKCSTASCSLSLTAPLPGTTNGVPAGQDFDVEVDFSGTNLPGYLASQPLAVIVDSADWGGGIYNFGHGVGTSSFPATSGTKNLSFPMPYDMTPRYLHVYIGYPNLYNGRVDVVGCGISVNPYQRFNITPIATLDSIDDEDPRSIQYTVGGNNTGAPVIVNWDRQLQRKRGGVTTIIDGNFNSNNSFTYTENRTYNPSGSPLVPSILRAGDQVCAWARINITDGWVGPGNSIAEASTKPPPANPAENCRTISDRPYTRFYGADSIAGSGFMAGGVCNNPGPNNIKTYISNHSDRSGSGAQFAALAMGQITGFHSANLRTSAPIFPNGLSIANTSSPPGGYTGEPVCSTDYFNEMIYTDGSPQRNPDSTVSTLSLSSLNNPSDDGKQTFVRPSLGKLTLNGTSNFGIRHTVFVDGDVNIVGDISYSAFTDLMNAPAFALVVSGNIYINGGTTSSVKVLDGLYVAQQKPNSNTGTIFTCSDGFDEHRASSPAALVGNCSDQLVVNGAFIAHKVKLLRTANSLRDSAPRELANIPCTKPSTPANSCAAELFRFTPELYFSPPPLNHENSSSGGSGFQSYSTLPPIL